MTTTDDTPVVRLGPPELAGPDSEVYLDDVLVLDCDQCGELSDWLADTPHQRNLLGMRARVHADRYHDGHVAAEGWVR